ncbi:uncharacterized protein LOC117915636 isoform X2 [Vitis riparia]|uniref:uncharacterized protein LOC117915636 isoform X2 n=1 Tax=Vitis riparia TaxID=96939 RepID=UPI00155A3589|nr:uncharacterized protein LOC117915636 isoform X2 [Vitis riparia]
METLSRVGCLTNCTHFPFPTSSPIYPPQSHSTRLPSLSVLRTPRPVGELAGEDVLRMFFKERELNGDFISKASDMLWQREVMKFVDAEAGTPPDTPQQPEGVKETEYEGGFLKLTRTQEWVLGDNSAPINKKAIAKVLQDDSERRKRLNLLKYEALKREILLLSVSIGTACSGYCLIVLSAQAAISYAAGVLFRGCRDCVQLLVPPAFVSTCGQSIQGSRSSDFHEKEVKENWNKKPGPGGSVRENHQG